MLAQKVFDYGVLGIVYWRLSHLFLESWIGTMRQQQFGNLYRAIDLVDGDPALEEISNHEDLKLWDQGRVPSCRQQRAMKIAIVADHVLEVVKPKFKGCLVKLVHGVDKGHQRFPGAGGWVAPFGPVLVRSVDCESARNDIRETTLCL